MTSNRTAIQNAHPTPTGRGTDFGYRVEARLDYPTPDVICGVLMDNRWQEIGWEMVSDGRGTPRPTNIPTGLQVGCLLSRNEAEALRWWFICAADSGRLGSSWCVETRIVECRVKYEFSVTPTAYIDAFDRRGDLPKDMKPFIAQKTAGEGADHD